MGYEPAPGTGLARTYQRLDVQLLWDSNLNPGRMSS
jgi:hypothetical protein